LGFPVPSLPGGHRRSRGSGELFDCLTILLCTIEPCFFSADMGPSVFGQGGPRRGRRALKAPLRGRPALRGTEYGTAEAVATSGFGTQPRVWGKPPPSSMTMANRRPSRRREGKTTPVGTHRDAPSVQPQACGKNVWTTSAENRWPSMGENLWTSAARKMTVLAHYESIDSQPSRPASPGPEGNHEAAGLLTGCVLTQL
jgi:hypothetical protein